jgi:hypothetical protein
MIKGASEIMNYVASNCCQFKGNGSEFRKIIDALRGSL